MTELQEFISGMGECLDFISSEVFVFRLKYTANKQRYQWVHESPVTQISVLLFTYYWDTLAHLFILDRKHLLIIIYKLLAVKTLAYLSGLLQNQLHLSWPCCESQQLPYHHLGSPFDQQWSGSWWATKRYCYADVMKSYRFPTMLPTLDPRG